MNPPARLLTLTLTALSCLALHPAAQRRMGSGSGRPRLRPASPEQRAEAHRTILRRFSLKAATAGLGLSKEATAFLDLYLDLGRNRREIRERRAPRSRFFRGTPHPVLERHGRGGLRLAAAFVADLLDEAVLPIKEVPALVKALGRPDFARHARAEPDTEASLRNHRVGLCHDLVNRLGGELAKVPQWPALRSGMAAMAMTALADKEPPLMEALDLLGRVGGDKEAPRLLAWWKKQPDGWPRYGRNCLLRALCSLEGAAGETFLRELLAKGQNRDKQVAIGCLGRLGSPLAIARLRKALTLVKEPRLMGEVELALVQAGDGGARKSAVATFRRMEEGPVKYHRACALARCGIKEVLPYLKKTLARLEKEGTGRALTQARFLERLVQTLEK